MTFKQGMLETTASQNDILFLFLKRVLSLDDMLRGYSLEEWSIGGWDSFHIIFCHVKERFFYSFIYFSWLNLYSMLELGPPL